MAKGTDAGQPSEPGDGREEQVKALTSQSVRRGAAQHVLSRNKQLWWSSPCFTWLFSAQGFYTLFAVVREFDHSMIFLFLFFFCVTTSPPNTKHSILFFFKKKKRSETCCFASNPKPRALATAPPIIVSGGLFSPLFEAPLCLRTGSHFTQTNPDETQSLVPTSTIDLVFGKQILLV